MTPACPKPIKNQSCAEPAQLSRPEYPSQSPTNHADTQISPITLKCSASKRLGRVEEGRGGLYRIGITPFPFPAHQTGRANFPHPAFRLASSRGTRRGAKMNPAQPKHAEIPEHGPSIRLRLEIELPLESPDLFRCLQAHRQSPRLLSVKSAPEVRVLPSAGITRHQRGRVGGGARWGWPPSAAQTARTVFP